mgnify:CR=1 FL=1
MQMVYILTMTKSKQFEIGLNQNLWKIYSHFLDSATSLGVSSINIRMYHHPLRN